jgi:Domain of unknown function (DUF3899)
VLCFNPLNQHFGGFFVNFRNKRRLVISASFQLVILVLSLLVNHKITLISYIDISFYVSSLLLFTSLLIYIIKRGFFDVMSKSFSLAFKPGQSKRKFDDIPSLSELIQINPKPLLFYGSITGLWMLIALVCYYFLRT